MNDVIGGIPPDEHLEIRHHPEGFDFVQGNRSLTAVETGLVNIMSCETVLRQYVDSVKHNYDYVLLDCLPSNNARPYDHEYSDLAVEVASLI